MKARAGTFLLVVVGVVLAFLLAEFFVRVFLPQDRMVTWIEMHPRGFMMNQSEIEALHQFNEREVRYHFNEIGLRGKKNIQSSDSSILLLGDSFTFGLLLNQEDTFASILQDKVDQQFPSKNFQLLNGGVGGAGLADWPAWLEHKGQEISPDIVILYFNYMDVDRAISKNLYVAQKQDSTLVESIRWKPRPFFMKLGRMGWYRWLQEYSEVMNILVKISWRYLYFSDQTDGFDQKNSEVPIPSSEDFEVDSNYSIQLSRLLIDRIRNWCQQNDCTFVLATTGFFEENNTGAYTSAYYKELTEKKSHQDAYFFDNTPCVQSKIEGDYDSIRIPGDSHPNEEGAQLIANCSMNWLGPFLEAYTGKP